MRQITGKLPIFCSILICIFGHPYPFRMQRALFFLLLLCSQAGWSQEEKKFKFGDITPADFQPRAYAIDSGAAAVVIADVGSTQFVGNGKGGFSLEFKNYRRAHILNANGYDIASVEIPLYFSGDAEELLDDLKAVTYNLENGRVVETKLDVKNAVFKDVVSRRRVIRKFTFPNIRPGSIIEYRYAIRSDFIFNLQPWEFQGAYPRLWSEYRVSQPEFFIYVTLTQGYHPYHIRDQKSRRETYNWSDNRGTGASERANIMAGVTDFRWVMKDVPALREERYTSTLRNHISRIEFQLRSIGEPYTPRNFLNTWPETTRSLLQDPDFGQQLSRDNGWLKDYLAEAGATEGTPSQKARRLFAWVRDHYTCTNRYRLYLEKPLREVARSRNGNVAEINLLLTALLLRAGIPAEPVILSTRGHGYTHSVYPLMDRFNYVICRIHEGDQTWLLDASDPGMIFGKIPADCYNGHARVVNEAASPLELTPDSIREVSKTSVFIINDEKGKWVGSFQQEPGFYHAQEIREAVKKNGAPVYFNGIKKAWGSEVTLISTGLDSLQKTDNPLSCHFDFDLPANEEDMIYFNPLLSEAYRENPFRSAERFYPVEMPYALDEVYNLQVEIPQGYELEELPSQIMLRMNEQNDGFFEYRVSRSGSNISFRSRLVVNRTYYAPEEYEMLREFFNVVVKKHNESIVFRKKK